MATQVKLMRAESTIAGNVFIAFGYISISV